MTANKQYKHIYTLLTIYITVLLLVVILANRFTIVFGLLEPGGIFVFPLTFIICDVVSEVYGYSMAKKFIWLGVFAEFAFAAIITLEMKSPYPPNWPYAKDYIIVFDPTLRFVLSSFLGLLSGEFLNIYLISKWKIILRGKYFILRSVLAIAFGQLVLSLIVDFSAFFNSTLELEQLIYMIFCGWLWKMVSTLVLIYPAWLTIKILKKLENIDIYDYKTNFNPFKFN